MSSITINNQLPNNIYLLNNIKKEILNIPENNMPTVLFSVYTLSQLK